MPREHTGQDVLANADGGVAGLDHVDKTHAVMKRLWHSLSRGSKAVRRPTSRSIKPAKESRARCDGNVRRCGSRGLGGGDNVPLIPI
jgi:hypothetical protein